MNDLGYKKLSRLADEGAIALAAAFETDKSANNIDMWRKLDVSVNNIGKDGGSKLIKSLGHNNTLTEIDLSGNSLGDECALVLAEVLKSNKTLRCIDVRNCGIGIIGVMALAKCLSRPDLSINVLDRQNGDSCAGAYVSACKSYETVWNIDVNDCNIGDRGAIALAVGMMVNTSVKNIG